MGQETKILFDRKENFRFYFNRRTGFYARTDLLDLSGLETGRQPFMATWPHMLDIGIMGHCDHARTGMCQAAGVQCYQRGYEIREPNMPFHDFKAIIGQVDGLVNQVALGGRGDPDCHEQFESILQCCAAHDVVPNYTTSGYRIDRKKAELTKQYCGAAAVSWYRTAHTRRAIQLFLEAGVKTNVHFVLSDQSLGEAISLLLDPGALAGINAIIFLLHKPVGQGRDDQVIRPGDPRLITFFNLVDLRLSVHAAVPPIKIGFDTCLFPALLNNCRRLSLETVDTCEAGRFSAYISPSMVMMPCSFVTDPADTVSLRTHSVLQAWHSRPFDAFRNRLRNQCPDCARHDICLGGCPVAPQIVLCDRRVRR